MTSWIDKKTVFQTRFDNLRSQAKLKEIEDLINGINAAIPEYISIAAQTPQTSQTIQAAQTKYTSITTAINSINTIKNQYKTLYDDILKFLKDNAKDTNLSGLLSQNGELQTTINRLEKIQKDTKVDVESSIARDKLLRSRDTDISRHQLFILDRPIRKGLIPYLWVISVLFIGIGLIIIKSTMPTYTTGLNSGAINGTTSSISTILLEFISNKIVIGSLLSSALVIIIFLSLKIAGVFGK